MAYDEDKRVKVFAIYGIPNQDSPFVSLGLFTIQGAVGEPIDISDFRARLNTALDGATSSQTDLVDVVLTQFDLWWLKEIQVNKDEGTEGVLMNVDDKRAIWVDQLGNILGVYNPFGSLMDQLRRNQGFGGGGRIVR